jgi:hypothetical protein
MNQLNQRLTGARCLISALVALSATVAHAARANANSLHVRLCTKIEFATGSSEVVTFIKDRSSGEKPPFNWCEAIDVDWLPGARLLRIHTAIQTDFAWTYTLVQANSRSSESLTGFGEGLVVGTSSNDSKSLLAFNDLLKTAQAPLNPSRMRSVCILYLFLIGRESHSGFFRRPEPAHEVIEEEYRTTDRRDGDFRIIRLTARTGPLRFKFSSSIDGKLHLDSVVEDGDSPRDSHN